MSKTIIEVENISKLYRLGQVGTGTISNDIKRWWHTVRGKEDPFMKIGQSNDRTQDDGTLDFVWSLKDINFEVKHGEVLGIIGRNGAGKSTLLKILSKITAPTTGRISIEGRVASLLEVGTGFHPELTGRENIFLNGTILGMSKTEVKSKLEEIVDFSGVAKYLDTPVKRYSSGMMVRLGFAVAAHLEPEILIVDEVLAVGDVEFQKKCLGKMKDVSGEGRTVLFVSHNMEAVKNLCTKAILLEKGHNVFSGYSSEVVSKYFSNNFSNKKGITEWDGSHKELDQVEMKSIKISQENEEKIKRKKSINISLEFFVKVSVELHFEIHLFSKEGILIFEVTSQPENYSEGGYREICEIPGGLLNTGEFYFDIMIVKNHNQPILKLEEVLYFEIEESKREIEFYGNWPGILRPELQWIKERM